MIGPARKTRPSMNGISMNRPSFSAPMGTCPVIFSLTGLVLNTLSSRKLTSVENSMPPRVLFSGDGGITDPSGR